MGWLHYFGRCVSCKEELVKDGKLIGGAGVTDHLLPRAKFPEGFRSHLNAVPSCARCNSIKATFDRQLKTEEFADGLSQDVHDRMLSLAREFISSRRAIANARFEDEERSWNKALARRKALDVDDNISN
jgi:hypothetical protein